MSTTKSTRVALLLGFLIIFASSGGGGEAPEALAFSDASATTADDGLLRRPIGNPCASSDYSVSFDSEVSLTDADASTIGPFAVSLPDGIYEVTVSTWLGGQELPHETNEQWSFSTDSGYESPTTIDSSPHLLMNQAWSAQEISATSSVELHHQAPATANAANSVHPLCIGFDEVDIDELESKEDTSERSSPEQSTSAVLP